MPCGPVSLVSVVPVHGRARALLRDVLPGVHGLVDTNQHEILQTSDFLTLLDRYPGWDWRRQPSTDLQ
ncbi:hypothetical protein [Streptomyces wuyuanensis]|uniref:hypothetical protein n=1 Tax=Streptomyces wuyuanensis TaxID=1196353 RepID=UPI00380FFE97